MTDPDRAIRGEVVVASDLESVWDAWTTREGIRTFFAPAANVELRVGGAYEIFFDPSAEPGRRGGDGMHLLAVQPKKMISFTWNAPLSLPEAREQRTSVQVRFFDGGPGQTRVTLFHSGWGEGGEWDQAFVYFERAWNEIVLPRLARRFAEGPIDWEKT